MVTVIYRRILDVVKLRGNQLIGLAWLTIILSDIAFVLGGAVVGIGLCAGILFSVGLSMVFLRIYRGEQVKHTQLFDFFSDWKTIKRVLCGIGWANLWIFLWSLIPIVGIFFAWVRIYEYRLVPYILATEPDVSPTKAIEISKQRTMGYKGKMFGADVLLGVGAVAVLLVFGLLCTIPGAAAFFVLIFLFVLVMVALYVPVIAGLLPAAFYEEIMNPTMSTTSYTDKFCAQCGAPLLSNASFCARCGNKVQ